MGNKIWALALVGAAAYLFKTKKGAEMRKTMGQKFNDLAGKAKEAYNSGRNGSADVQPLER